MKSTTIVKILFEARRLYSIELGDKCSDHWEDLSKPEQAAFTKLVKPLFSSRKTTAEQHHNAWVSAKKSKGWTLGKHSTTRKTHPHLVAFADLPKRLKAKDEMLTALGRELSGFLRR